MIHHFMVPRLHQARGIGVAKVMADATEHDRTGRRPDRAENVRRGYTTSEPVCGADQAGSYVQSGRLRQNEPS
jgi:hypothetical protein